MLELLVMIFVFGIICGAWVYCTKNPEVCKDWTIERRKIDQPLDFPCRRKKQRREDA